MRAKHPVMEKRFLHSRGVRERNILLSSSSPPLPSFPIPSLPLFSFLSIFGGETAGDRKQFLMRSSCLVVCPLPLSETLACHLSGDGISGRLVKWFVKIVRKEPAKGLGQSARKAEQSQLSWTGVSPLPPRECSSIPETSAERNPRGSQQVFESCSAVGYQPLPPWDLEHRYLQGACGKLNLPGPSQTSMQTLHSNKLPVRPTDNRS